MESNSEKTHIGHQPLERETHYGATPNTKLHPSRKSYGGTQRSDKDRTDEIKRKYSRRSDGDLRSHQSQRPVDRKSGRSNALGGRMDRNREVRLSILAR